jgi:hypothetical protein
VYGRFRDTAGNVSSVVSDTIELNTTVDPEYGLTINEGALFTNQTAVTLTISARPGTAQMKVSNDGGFAGAAWESYAIHKAWTITHYGSYVIPRVVYIRYKDVSGNVSATYQDDIILDVTPPTGSVSIVGPGGLSRLLATNSIVTLSLSATDDVSGVGGMLLSNTPDFGGASWEAYATIRIWDLGNNNTVYVRFRDNAGNISQTYSASLSTATSAQISPASGGTLDSGDGHVHLDFPAGAVTNTTTITYTGQPAPMHALGSFRFAGRSFTLEASASGQPVTHFTRPFTLTLTYADADWQATGITDEDQLNLYYWGGLQWIGLLPCASCSLDTVNNRLIVVLDHLTEFGFLACPLAADVDHNGVVDIRDIQQAVTGWHSTYTLSDIQGIAAAWGTGCGP